MKSSVLCAALSAVFALSAGSLPLVPMPQKVVEKEGLCSSKTVTCSRDASLKPEGYRLTVTPRGVTIVSADDAGEFHARPATCRSRRAT